ncbi:MAG: ABC transporter permease subunit [Rhodobacterales bacterium]|nr:ABC transporter permease subunit [Rhodobacterales bacterium]
MSWWIRPLVRIIAALTLPLAVPAVITMALWALPGDPAEIICPPAICPGTEALAQRWGLDQGPVYYYFNWLSSAIQGDFGDSWRVMAGEPVTTLRWDSLPTTAALVLLALIPLILGGVTAAAGLLPRRLDPLWQGMGLVPSVILALGAAAYVQLTYGALSSDGWPAMVRLLLGAAVLGISDGALAGAVVGTRSVFEEEIRSRYVQIALLRGESPVANALPNVLPALIGQFRGRILHVLSGAVVVEVVLGIPGLGDLLWDGTLLQDFGVVLAAAWAFGLLSAVLLLFQATCEILLALYVRRSPVGVA